MGKKWHWQMIKLITKQSMGKKKKGNILDQTMINRIKNNRQIIIKILKKGNKAEKHLKVAVNQFNFAVEKEEVDASIFLMNECEEELHRAVEFAQKELSQILWKEGQ